MSNTKERRFSLSKHDDSNKQSGSTHRRLQSDVPSTVTSPSKAGVPFSPTSTGPHAHQFPDHVVTEMEREGRPRSHSASSAPNLPDSPTTSTVYSRTLKGAANMRKAIIATLTNSQPQEEEPPKAVFDHLGIEVSDPLHQASEEQILRLIENKGGAVATVRQYSADVAESNLRVAQERNAKQRILEENRRLREDNEALKAVQRELEARLERAMNLLRQFTDYHRQHSLSKAEIKIIESPSGPYLLDTSTYHIIGSSRDHEEPQDVPLERASSAPSHRGNALDAPEQPKLGSRKAKDLTPITVTQAMTRKQLASPRLRSETLEMRSSADLESLPPGLQVWRTSTQSDQTDRLGFLFTTNREQRHQEALLLQSSDTSESSSIDSSPQSDDEFNAGIKTLKSHDENELEAMTLGTIDSSQGDLLCYAPVGPALRLVSVGSDGRQKFVDISKTKQNAEAVVFTSNGGKVQAPASLAAASVSGVATPIETALGSTKALNSLLARLNEAYDNQQRRRVSEWKAFEQHVRASIRRNRDASTSDYSMSSIPRLCNPSTASPEIMKRFNTMIMLGIPTIYRQDVWMEKSGANVLKSPGAFQTLLKKGGADRDTMYDIEADVERTLTNNIFFRDGVGREKLHDVLVAYSWYNPAIGYSQGLNIIAANILLLVSTAEDAFWLLVAVIDNILPFEYYHRSASISGAALETDGNVLLSYVNDLQSKLHKHICSLNVSLTMFTPGWFISVYAACLSGEALYRFWDILFGFCDGRYIFCFALALLKVNHRGLLACQSNEELMMYLGGKMTNAAVSLDILIREALKFARDVTQDDLNSRRHRFGVSEIALED